MCKTRFGSQQDVGYSCNKKLDIGADDASTLSRRRPIHNRLSDVNDRDCDCQPDGRRVPLIVHNQQAVRLAPEPRGKAVGSGIREQSPVHKREAGLTGIT